MTVYSMDDMVNRLEIARNVLMVSEINMDMDCYLLSLLGTYS